MLFIHFMEFKDTALYSPSSTYPQVCVSGCEIWSSGSGQMGAFYTRLAALVFYVWALSPDFSRLIGERQLAKLCSQPAKKRKRSQLLHQDHIPGSGNNKWTATTKSRIKLKSCQIIADSAHSENPTATSVGLFLRWTG